MNIVCLNCETVVKTEDPRVKFCGKVCKNRFNVRKWRAKPRKEKTSIEALRAMVKGIETKKVVRVSAASQTYQKDEWIDP